MFQRARSLSIVVLLAALVGASPALAGPGPSITESGLAASPSQVEFGQVDLHFGGHPQQSISVTNESLSEQTITSATITGADAASFQIVQDGCTNATLSPANTCNIELQFRPSERGEKNAVLTLSDGEGTLEVPLSGTSVTGELEANPSPLSFSALPYSPPGTFGEETPNETRQVNIEDNQNASAQVGSVSITGPDAESFSIQYGDCENDLLGSHNSCDVGVRFQPVSLGAQRAQLVIQSDAPNGPLVIELEGEGLNGPKIVLSSREANLGDVPIGSSAHETFTVSNGGDYPLFIQQSFLVSGTPAMFPVLSDTCSKHIIQPGSSCAFTVGFRPSAQGADSAALLFITNAQPQINVLGIAGTGVPAPADSPLLMRAPAEPPAPAPAAASPSSAAAKTSAVAPAPLLTVATTAHVYTYTVHETLDTGIAARCPEPFSVCYSRSLITTRIRSRASHPRSRAGTGGTTIPLGFAAATLRSGHSTVVRIPLTRAARALLRRRGHLHATVETVVTAGGSIVAARSRAVVLIAP